MDNLWQTETLEQLKDLLRSFDVVQAMVVVGSFASDSVQPDFWSDIDLVMVVADNDIDQFFPATDWLKPMGDVYTTSQSEDPPRYTSRICFTDMRRLDLVFILASAFDDPRSWNYNPFQNGHRVLFSKSRIVDQFLLQEFAIAPASGDPQAQFAAMSNDFWFKGMLAVSKVIRNDLLIALHLTLDLVRDALVLKMMLRDRSEGTRHHRIGGIGNELVMEMNASSPTYSRLGILSSIEQSAQLFDQLSKEWSDNYQDQRFPLLEWINIAREDIGHRC